MDKEESETMTTDAPTPRTDKLCLNFVQEYSNIQAKFDLIALARQLERELAAKEVDALIYQSKIHDRDDCILLLKAELAAKEAELQKELADHQHTVDTYRNYIEPKHENEVETLRAELAQCRKELTK